MKKVEANKDILDFGWNVDRNERSFSPVKPNSDSLYKASLDFSSLCRKRLLQQTVQERLQAPLLRKTLIIRYRSAAPRLCTRSTTRYEMVQFPSPP